MIHCFDIDGTICGTENGDYEGAKPFPKMVEHINNLYELGHKIIFHTARGTMSGIDWRELTEKQLKDWGINYHELHFGKPYADYYYDDKAVKW